MKRLCCLAMLPFLLTGCTRVLHELQPHRLWRINYTDAPGRTDGAYFSVEDQLPPAGEPYQPSQADTDAGRHSRG